MLLIRVLLITYWSATEQRGAHLFLSKSSGAKFDELFEIRDDTTNASTIDLGVDDELVR